MPLSYWLVLLSVSVIPAIGLPLIYRLISMNYNFSNASDAIIRLNFACFLFPIYVVWINFFTAKKFTVPLKSFAFHGVVTLASVLIFVDWMFDRWGIYGMTIHSANGSLFALDVTRTIGSVIGLVGTLIAYQKLKRIQQI